MFRNVLAVVLGVVLAFVLIMVVERLGHVVYPPPADVDFTDPAAIGAYVQTVPAPALLLVLAAWLTGTICGGLLACFVAKNRPMVYASIVGGLVLIGTAVNLYMIPHPTWFAVVSLLTIVVATWFTGRIGEKFVSEDILTQNTEIGHHD